MKTLGEVHFEANVVDIPDGLMLQDFGPKYYAGFLQRLGSDIKVAANKEISLKCGTRAYRTDINWLWNKQFQLTTLVVSAYKDNKCVFLVAHPMVNPEKFAAILESLAFE